MKALRKLAVPLMILGIAITISLPASAGNVSKRVVAIQNLYSYLLNPNIVAQDPTVELAFFEQNVQGRIAPLGEASGYIDVGKLFYSLSST
jgi:hypothetical protein